MTRSSAPSPRRLRRWSVLLTTALVALGIAAPGASAASGVVSGQAVDAPPNEAPSAALDVVSASVLYNRNSGKMKATVQMAAKPQGDVDIQYGITQPGGACAPELTLRTNIAKGPAQLYGNAGNVRKNASQNYAEGGTITASVTDEGLAGKKNINCFAVRVYGAGANHNLRDTLGPVAMAERAGPSTGCLPGDTDCSTPECVTSDTCDDTTTCLPEDGCDDTTCTPDDGCGGEACTPEECPADPCASTDVPTDPSGDVPASSRGAVGDGDDGCVPTDVGGGDDGSGGLQLSVRFYGVPKRLKRGRSYDIRIRIRNDADADARKLKVRLAKKPGVAMSRRVASVSNVRSGKGITVHIRVRLTSREAKRTVRVTVKGADVDERRSLVLRRRGAK